MTELTGAYAAEQDEVLFDLEMTMQDTECSKVAVTVDIPSEFQALLSGLCSDGGRDREGNITKLWKIDGIQSIDFSLTEPGKTMVYNLKPGYDIAAVYNQLTDWLIDLQLRRQATERSLARSAING